MPVVQIEGVGRVQFPDDMTPEQITAAIETEILPKQHDPSAGGGSLSIGPWDTGIRTPQSVDRFLAGAGKTMTDIGRGVGQLLGRVSNEDVAESRQLDKPLMATGAGKVGAITGGIASAAPAALIPGANTVVGAGLIGAGYGAVQPVESGKERAMNVAIGGAAGAGAQAIGQKISQFAARKLAERAAVAQSEKAQHVVRDTLVSEARKAGYRIPPSTTNPTIKNRIVEGIAGKAATQQSAAVKNQEVTNRLIRLDLGLPEDAPLTTKTLDELRKQAGGVYKAIASVGEIIPDDQYLDDLMLIARSVDDVARDFPEANVGANAEINKLVDSMLVDRFKAKSALEYIKQLRKSASGNLSGANAADPSKRALGFAQRDAAAALEETVMRHLEKTGKGGLAKAFDKARQLIAKTYSVEAALNEGTGNVVASKLATQLKRGKPLSGNMELVARFAQAFPRAAEEIRHSPGVSALDAMVAVGGAPLNPTLIATPFARIGARELLLSGAGQSLATPSYAPGKVGTLALKTMEQTKRAAIPSVVYATQQ